MKIHDEINYLKQDINEIEKQKAKLEFYDSLINAVKVAGGNTNSITTDISLEELADIFAINKVRFTYIGVLKINADDTLKIKKSWF